MSGEHSAEQPDRAEIDALEGPAVIEFGTNGCGYCRDGREIARVVRPQSAERLGWPGSDHFDLFIGELVGIVSRHQTPHQ